jgi:hypothetical protein
VDQSACRRGGPNKMSRNKCIYWEVKGIQNMLKSQLQGSNQLSASNNSSLQRLLERINELKESYHVNLNKTDRAKWHTSFAIALCHEQNLGFTESILSRAVLEGFITRDDHEAVMRAQYGMTRVIKFTIVIGAKSAQNFIDLLDMTHNQILQSSEYLASSSSREHPVPGSARSSDTTVTNRNNVITITRAGVNYCLRGYAMNVVNGETLIDGRPISDSDPRIISVDGVTIESSESEISQQSNPITRTLFYENRPVSPRQFLTNTVSKYDAEKYSKSLQKYLKTFNEKESFKAQINSLALTEREKETVEAEFSDPVTFDIMDIPVSLNEKFYDLSTLAQLEKDPFTREDFNQLEIQSGRQITNRMEDFIKIVRARIASEAGESVISGP